MKDNFEKLMELADEKRAAKPNTNGTESASVDTPAGEPEEKNNTAVASTATPATEAAATEGGEENEVEDASDIMNLFGEAIEQTQQQTQETEKTKPAQAELPDDIKEQLSLMETLMSDDAFVWAMQQRKEGKDFISAIREQLPINVDSLTPEKLYEMECLELGVSQEELESSLEDFREKKPIEQLREVQAYKKALKEREDAKLKLFRPDTTSMENARMEHEKAIKQQQQMLIDTRKQSAEKLQQLKGIDFLGLTLTEEIINEVDSLMWSGAIIPTKDGKGVDVQAMYENALNRIYVRESNKLMANAETKGKVAMLREQKNVKRHEGTSVSTSAKTHNDDVRAAIKGLKYN